MMEESVGEYFCADAVGGPCTFQYVLLRDIVIRDGAPCEDYGVMIRSDCGEQAAIAHISPIRQNIENLLHLLCQHGVSPLHLRDIIEDWL